MINRFSKSVALTLFCFAMLASAEPAEAVTFNVMFDPSTTTAPPGFFTAMTYVIQFYESTFLDTITINLHVGWGDIDGEPLESDALGESLTEKIPVLYPALKTALVNDAKTPTDAEAVSHLPASDPASGNPFSVATSEAKALGLYPADSSDTDGWVGFSKTVTYTFDPNNRAVSGAFDFFGVAFHEVSEVMGRTSGFASPLDLFRYSSPGILVIMPMYGPTNYFSIDGGVTSINTFNSISGGDLGDWAGLTPDAFNESSSTDQVMPVSNGDLIVMDALGYDRRITRKGGQLTSQ